MGKGGSLCLLLLPALAVATACREGARPNDAAASTTPTSISKSAEAGPSGTLAKTADAASARPAEPVDARAGDVPPSADAEATGMPVEPESGVVDDDVPADARGPATAVRGTPVHQEGTALWWLLCPSAAAFDRRCTGGSWRDVQSGCPEGYHVPTREEMVGLLDGCPRSVREGGAGTCLPCSLSETCRTLFGGGDGEGSWTSSRSPRPGRAWAVWLTDGIVADDPEGDHYRAACVRTGPPPVREPECTAETVAAGDTPCIGPRLFVVTRPWTEVYLDGRPTGRQTPLADYELSVGRHTLRLVNEEAGVDETIPITAEAGRRLVIRRNYEEP